ncbi:hypothetical protein BA011_26280 (plasmid) [Rhizobium leguminosarum]|uniref:Uncharacterized protein n=1 Tax=Rhizobium leguminosarum TaxID=384 RepID=A0A1B1CHP8_RHILE|nr:hypothetical protein BA011_26280 [Rhizobium leguminosarum]
MHLEEIDERALSSQEVNLVAKYRSGRLLTEIVRQVVGNSPTRKSAAFRDVACEGIQVNQIAGCR